MQANTPQTQHFQALEAAWQPRLHRPVQGLRLEALPRGTLDRVMDTHTTAHNLYFGHTCILCGYELFG